MKWSEQAVCGGDIVTEVRKMRKKLACQDQISFRYSQQAE